MEHALKLNHKELLEYINKLKTEYYFQTPSISDEEYDSIVELLPKNIKPGVGSTVPVTFKDKTQLPFWMGSLSKIKSGTGEFDKFVKTNSSDIIVSDKLDGLSGLYIVKNSSKTLYTRGNGEEGRNVSYLLQYINMPPLPVGNYRGELIISKQNFKNFKDDKNARTTAVGLVNSKTLVYDKLKYIDFIPYEIIKEDKLQECPSTQYSLLKKHGCVVWNKLYNNNNISDRIMKELTEKREIESEYDIDGVVVCWNEKYIRSDGKDPDNSIAYKLVKGGLKTKVLQVDWKISKDGFLKPTVLFDPISIDGTVIKRATAHNASYVYDNNIGPGSLIQVTRSNNVIPYILSVIKGTTASMPDCEWEWNSTKKDAVTKLETVEEKTQNIVYFFKEIGCLFFGEKMIEKCVKYGCDNVCNILEFTIDDFKQLDGVETKSATKIYNNIRDALMKCDEPTIMSASNMFGRTMGIKRIKLFVDVHPDWDVSTPSMNDLLKIDGYQTKTVECVLNGIPKFIDYLGTFPPPYNKISFYRKAKINTTEINPSETLMIGQKIVCTGFRSKELESWIEKNGGENTTAISKKTTLLLTKDNTASTKIDKAKELGIDILLVKDFIKKYNIVN